MKLVLEEPGSDDATTLWEEADTVVSVGVIYVEARAALARAGRLGRMSRQAALAARETLESYVRRIHLVRVGPRLVGAAGDAADDYALRALHALHLSAALSLAGAGVVVATWDHELRRAAAASGLAVAPAG